MAPDKSFTALNVPSMALTDKNEYLYRVYTSKTEFTEVTAHDACQAIEKAGIHHPYKIIHVLPNTDGIIAEGQLSLREGETVAAEQENHNPTESLTEAEPEKSASDDAAAENPTPSATTSSSSPEV